MMKLLSDLKDGWFKPMAKQLRLPSGLLAKLTGKVPKRSHRYAVRLYALRQVLRKIEPRSGGYVYSS